MEQTVDHLKLYGALVAVVLYFGYRALQRNPAATLLFIYSVVSLIQGFVLSGGLDVDINVFFDFAIACAIGLGLLQNAIVRFVADESRTWRAAVALLAWLAISLTPVFSASGSGVREGRDILAAMAASPQQADVAYIKATPGGPAGSLAGESALSVGPFRGNGAFGGGGAFGGNAGGGSAGRGLTAMLTGALEEVPCRSRTV